MTREERYGYGYDATVVRGDKIQEKRSFYTFYCSVDDLIKDLQEASEGLEDAIMDEEPDYGGGTRQFIVGFRPMTEQELKRVTRLRERAKKDAAKAKTDKEKQELETYNKLKKKYEGKVNVRKTASSTRWSKTTED